VYQRIRKTIVISTAIIFHLLLIFHLLFSPVIIVKASFHGIINASLITFCLIFLLSLFWGRAYCSWFCPGCGVQELLSMVVKRKSKNTKALYIKYVIFGLWITAIATGFIMNGFKTVDLTYGMTNIPTGRKIILTVGAIMIMVPLTAIFGRFAFCKYLCWQAPFMVIGTKLRNRINLPGLRLKSMPESCISCKICTKKCPMNLNVMSKARQDKMDDAECILCGNCIDHCKQRVIRYSLEKPEKQKNKSNAKQPTQ
jgi:ferredoxin-type protein NapH